MDILSKFYAGELRPADVSLGDNHSYQRNIHLFSETLAELEPLLDDAQKKLLITLLDSKNDISAIIAEEYFTMGWKMGTQLLLESLTPYSCGANSSPEV